MTSFCCFVFIKVLLVLCKAL
ncbi:hypothetical protein PP583_gp49 [Pseudoalteromonas phage HS6]|nr:hypothetical protein PP583_gp49 [Pseudoalteromonas phage HS6]